MHGEQGLKAVLKKVHLVKIRGKGCSFFFFDSKGRLHAGSLVRCYINNKAFFRQSGTEFNFSFIFSFVKTHFHSP